MNEILGNLDSLRSEMDKGEFDAIIAMSPENVTYTSGVGIWSQKIIRDRSPWWSGPERAARR